MSDTLSEREEQILCRIIQGKTNKEIAAELLLKPGTIRAYLSRIFMKAAVENRTQLAIWGREHGYTTLREAMLALV